jgi:hypothetical protein
MKPLAEFSPRQHRIAAEFVTAIKAADLVALERLIDIDNEDEDWSIVFHRVRRINNPPESVRAFFLAWWLNRGHFIRDIANDGRQLVGALRAMLPQYHGPGLTLYRGESATALPRRRFGIAWTSVESVADGFCHFPNVRETHEGGTAVLQAYASPDAILCAAADHGDPMGDNEIIVDPKRLAGVRVLRRYPQVPYEEFQRRQEQRDVEITSEIELTTYLQVAENDGDSGVRLRKESSIAP